MKNYLRYAALLLVFLLTLSLVGCNEDASSLKDGMKKSMEIESSRSSTSLSVKSNMPPEEINEHMNFLFSMLEEGITLELEMESLTAMAIEMAVHGEDQLREEGLWAYEENLTADIFVRGGRTALKTAADPVYLLIDPTEAALLGAEEAPELEAAFGEGYSEQQIQMMLDFMVPFIEDFAFQFSDVQNLGAVELELPDGTVETEAYRLQMDSEEIMDFIAYTSRQLAESEHFKNYILEAAVLPLERMREEGALPEDEMPSPEEMQELAESSYQMFRIILLDIAEVMEQDPQVLRDEFGLDISVTEDYYLDGEGYIRKTESTYHIRAEHEMLAEVLGTPVLDLEIQSEAITWDINEPITVDFPSAEETVSFFALMADPALAEELGDGPLGELVQAISQMAPVPVDGAQLFINLEEEIIMLDGEPLEMEVEPYMEEGALMLPFRQMAALAGGEVSWDAENRQVTYRDAEREILVTIGSNTALVNGAEVALQQPAAIVQDRTMVPAELLEHFTQFFFAEEGIASLIF